METKFKAGDRVKIIGTFAASARENRDYVGTVTDVRTGRWDEHKDRSQIEKLGGNYYIIIDGEKICWPNDVVAVERTKKRDRKAA